MERRRQRIVALSRNDVSKISLALSENGSYRLNILIEDERSRERKIDTLHA
jgi:hypothetical protein